MINAAGRYEVSNVSPPEWTRSEECLPPRDGSEFLAYNINMDGCMIMRWSNKCHDYVEIEDGWQESPDFWMPILTPLHPIWRGRYLRYMACPDDKCDNGYLTWRGIEEERNKREAAKRGTTKAETETEDDDWISEKELMELEALDNDEGTDDQEDESSNETSAFIEKMNALIEKIERQ